MRSRGCGTAGPRGQHRQRTGTGAGTAEEQRRDLKLGQTAEGNGTVAAPSPGVKGTLRWKRGSGKPTERGSRGLPSPHCGAVSTRSRSAWGRGHRFFQRTAVPIRA